MRKDIEKNKKGDIMNAWYVALSSAEEPSVLAELWQYFYNTYINPSEYYEHLNLGAGGLWSIRIIILGICIGIVAAAFSAVFTKRVLGNIVRTVLAENALSTDTALTLEEMGLEGSLVARIAVRKNVSVRRVVKCVEEQEFIESQNQARKEYNEKRENDKSLPRFKESEYKVNPYADRFYIPEKMKYMADIKFDKVGSTWFSAIMMIVVMIVVFIAIIVALPYILSLVNDIVGSFGGTPKNML